MRRRRAQPCIIGRGFAAGTCGLTGLEQGTWKSALQEILRASRGISVAHVESEQEGPNLTNRSQHPERPARKLEPALTSGS